MTGEFKFLLAIVVIVLIMVVLIQASKNIPRIKHLVLSRLTTRPKATQRKHKRKSQEPVQPPTVSEPETLTAEQSKAELARLQKLIEDRIQTARDTDISYHLWGLYKALVRYTSPHSLDQYIHDGEWYDVKILHVGAQNGLSEIEFELQGASYKFVDNEEQQGWHVNMKSFSLCLYDDSDRCLIEIPMRMNVDSAGRNYSISSGGPKAFLAGDWINDFINVKLKHQSMRNQEIREQKHQERLTEIADLKERYGILD